MSEPTATETTGFGEATTQLSAGKPSAGVSIRLIVMMLMEFFVPGTFVATFGLILFEYDLSSIVGASYALAAIAAIISPMFLGAVADRFLATQKVLGLAHIIGGALILFLPAAIQANNPVLVLALVFIYKIFYQPTVGLANSIAFRHLGSNQRMFPYVRVFGTLGWVAAGLTIGALGLSSSTNALTFTAIASFALGIYAFTLPNTRPGAKGARFSFGDIVGAKAFVLLRNRSFLTFMICAVLTSISLGTYNSYASPFLRELGIDNVAGVLTIGQASEVLFILTIPFVLKRIGMKGALLAGMCMWGVRFGLIALAAGNGQWLAVAAVALHGICSDFFVIVGAMYIDRVAPIELAAQAQSMLILVIQGIGASIGSIVSGLIFNATVATNTEATAADWLPMWILPMVAAVITAILWVTFFRAPSANVEERIQIRRPVPVGAR